MRRSPRAAVRRNSSAGSYTNGEVANLPYLEVAITTVTETRTSDGTQWALTVKAYSALIVRFKFHSWPNQF